MWSVFVLTLTAAELTLCLSHSYIYDPSVEVDLRKTDSTGSSLYHSHHLPGMAPSRDTVVVSPDKQKQGFHNLGYSKSNESTLKLEVDNNQVNQRLHSAPSNIRDLHQQGGAPPSEGGLYIIQPDMTGPRWMIQERTPSQVPVYPNIHEYDNQRGYGEQEQRGRRTDWDRNTGKCTTSNESLSADEIDEGVGGMPDYPCDTGDEGSVLSVDIHTSTTSLSSVDTRDGLRLPKTTDVSTMESGISVTKCEEDEDEEEVQSVTDSMVAEALAALEAATSGEDFD